MDLVDNEAMLNQVESLVRSYSAFEFFDWDYISAIPMSFDMLLRLEPYLNWAIVSRKQIIDDQTYQRFHRRLDIHNMQHNPNVAESVIRNILHLVDWDVLQTSHKLSKEFLQDYQSKLDDILLLRYQNLDPEYVVARLKLCGSPKVHTKLLKIACEHQAVPESYLLELHNEYISGEMGCDVIPHEIVIKHQSLSMDFIQKVYISCNSPQNNFVSAICQYQKLTDQFIIKNSDKLPAVEVLKYQHGISQSVWGLFLNPDTSHNMLVIVKAIITGQDFNPEIFQRLIAFGKQNAPPESDYESWLHNIYIAMFLRTISGSEPPLDWSRHDVESFVIPHINWREISSIKMDSYQIDFLIDEYIGHVDLYQLIKYNMLTESQVIKLEESHLLTPIEWSLVLHKAQKSSTITYSKAFLNRYGDRREWWKFLNTAEELRALPHSAEFLSDFVNNADWLSITQNILPKWFIMGGFAPNQ